MAAGESVACEPRLFVGQVPATARDEDLWPIFSTFGSVRNLHLLKGSDGKPRGCAMVLYARWSQAEAASLALNGHSSLIGGQSRPLVVHFANPRRSPQGPPEPGIAPRKLFVGQVPKDITEDQLRPYFEACGDIEHINILRTQQGQSAGCAFVQFRTWAQAETAIDRHNATTRLGTAEVPLVVKFADAKKRDTANAQLGRRLGEWGPGPAFRRHPLSLGELGLQGAPGWPGMQGRAMGAEHGMLHDESYGAGIPGGPQGPHAGDYSTYPGSLNPAALGGEQPLLSQMALAGGAPGAAAAAYGMPPEVAGNGSVAPNVALANSLAGNAGGVNGAPYGDLLAMQGGRQGPGAPPPNANVLSQQLMHMNLGGPPQAPGYGAMPRGDIIGSGPRVLGDLGGDLAAHTWGQKISSHNKLNEWKLFVGQVPLEAAERDLFALFGPLGEVIELYILRNNNGKSRGCAFVTYATKALAQQAITQLNGKQVPPGKTLVVKFADRAQAGKGQQVGTASISGPLLTATSPQTTPPPPAGSAPAAPPISAAAPPVPQFFS